MSLRAFAREMRVSLATVQRAIKSGRLRASIAYGWRCYACGRTWESVGLGPDDPGPGAEHDCPEGSAEEQEHA